MRSAERGRAVFDRINARCRHELEWNAGCPIEVFVSSADWHDLGAYLDTKAKYYPGEPAPLTGIKMHIDGVNQPVEVRDVGRLVFV